MKKRLLCAVLCLCLIGSMLAQPAMAAHTCTDIDGDYWCDDCYEVMPHYCSTCDGDANCDICYEVMQHECMYNGDFAICGKCFETAEHDCVDEDDDYLCDRCFEEIAHTCKDSDKDYWCDLCGWIMDHDCKDSDRDYLCDLCYWIMDHDCKDSDRDYWCDICEEPLEHDCADANGDLYCDICYDILIPDSYVSILGGSAKSFLDDREPLYVDVYDVEDGIYMNFAILTGKEVYYSMLVLRDLSYDILVSKKNHVSRSYRVNASDANIANDIELFPLGDASQDGKVNIGDTARIYSHARGTSLITDEYTLECANVNGDSKVNIGDAARVYAHCRGTNPLY